MIGQLMVVKPLANTAVLLYAASTHKMVNPLFAFSLSYMSMSNQPVAWVVNPSSSLETAGELL